MRRWSHYLGWSLCLATVSAGLAGAQGNLAPNPGLEEGQGERPAHWSVADPGAHAKAEWATAARSGQRGLFAGQDDTGGLVWWSCDLIVVQPGQTYTLSVWYRCGKADAGPPTLQVQAADGANLIDWNLPVHTDWTQFRQSFTLRPQDQQIRIALISYYRAGQTIWWDDVSLAETYPAGTERGPRTIPIASTDTAQTAIADRPYELGNRAPDYPPTVMFADLRGWRMQLHPGVEGTAAVSAQQRIWGDRCLRLRYHMPTPPPGDPHLGAGGLLAGARAGGALEVIPPEPIPIPQPFDAVQLWVNADNYYSPHQPQVTVRLLDGDGRATDVCLGPVNWMYWFLMYAPAPAGLKPPVRLERIILSSITNPDPLDLYFDALAFIQAPKGPLKSREWKQPVPFPTRAETILPSVRQPVRNAVRQEGEVFFLDCLTPDGPVTYRYEPRTGTLSDIAALVPGEGTWQVLSGGGPVLTQGGPIGGSGIVARLKSARMRDGAVETVWQVAGGPEPVTITYQLRAWGKSLVIDAGADRPLVSSFSAGRVVGAPGARAFWAPYANATGWPQPHVLITDQHFASVTFDWYSTHSSAFYGAGEVAADGARIFDRADYWPDLSGVRSPLRERIFVTVSNHFDEVLWNIPNPPSPLKSILRENLFITRMHYGGGPEHYDREFAFWKRLKSYGVAHLIIRHHADFWRTRETFTFKDQAAPARGGDAVAQRYLHNLRGLGYRVGLYTDYLLISPLSEAWHPDLAALTAEGDRAEQAFATYFLKPSRAAELQAQWAPRLHAKFGTSASYCDQLTQARPSWVEFDPRVPGATRQRNVLESWGRLLLNERVAHHGPCFSEGGYQAIWAGLCDGGYAQTLNPDGPVVPDFALRKLHLLGADAGYDLAWLDQPLDRLLAYQIVYGHIGMNWGSSWSGDVSQIDVPSLLRSYFMMQQLQYRYVMEPVADIRYFDGARWLDTDEALRAGVYQRGQVRTIYRNGLTVVVNTNRSENLTVELASRSFVLPPNGWAAWDRQGFLEYSALRDGRRQDFVASPEYVYLDGHGSSGEAGGVASAGQVIVLRAPGALRVIPVDGKTPARLHLPSLGLARTALVRLVWSAEGGERRSSRQVPWPADGWLSLQPPAGSFSVQITGP